MKPTPPPTGAKTSEETLLENSERIAELAKFNQTVNTRQVRRYYARVTAKRER